MRLPRRTFLHLAGGAAALPAMSRFAWGQAYPSRPVRIVVGFSPAGSTTLTRARRLRGRAARPFLHADVHCRVRTSTKSRLRSRSLGLRP
jgi:tripartite-type tricarboxylate transporter receptor subunit TctC